MPQPNQIISLTTFFLHAQPGPHFIPEATGNSRPIRILLFQFLNNLPCLLAESSEAFGLSNLKAKKAKENFAGHFFSPHSNAISDKARK